MDTDGRERAVVMILSVGVGLTQQRQRRHRQFDMCKSGERMKFDCDCGFEYQMSARVHHEKRPQLAAG